MSPAPGSSALDALVVQLAAPDPIVRESAAARLTVQGARAVPLLRDLVVASDKPAVARAVALRTLGDIDRPAAVDAAAGAVAGSDVALARAAIDLLGDVALQTDDRSAADSALEQIARLVLEPSLGDPRRLALIEAIDQLPDAVKAPLIDALATDPSPAVVARAGLEAPTVPRGALVRWSDDGHLPLEADTLTQALARDGARVPITVLQRLIDRVRAHERTAVDAEAWRQARGRLHEALAQRGSRLALYDLRETLEDRSRSVDEAFLAAAHAIGDVTCLEAVAVRWIQAGDDDSLRDRFDRLFHAIVTRERLRRRSPAIVTLLKRHPAAVPLAARK